MTTTACSRRATTARAVANADQLDTDADGQGDACDADDDGDGISDTAEAAIGSKPLVKDSDGDGLDDGADSCVLQKGKAPTGCPEFTVVDVLPPADKTAPKLTVTGVVTKAKLADFLKGVAGKAQCNEACTLDMQLLGSARAVTLASAGDLVLGAKTFPSSSANRSFKVKPSKKLVGKAKKLKAKLVIIATDKSGNRTTKAINLSVKK